MILNDQWLSKTLIKNYLCSFGLATETTIFLPSISFSFISEIAFLAPLSSSNSTKPNPLLLPLILSNIIEADKTFP